MGNVRLALPFASIAVVLLAAACARPPATPPPGPTAPVVEYVTRQEILTPLPLRVRMPEGYGAEHVLVFFHTWGSRAWGTMELGRVGQTWSGEVSCREVSTVTGDTRYFFLALDSTGDPVVGSGSPEWPHVATIVGSLPDGPQGLPGEEPPPRCHDPADCPPDFPGCPAYAWLRPPCLTDADCKSGKTCAWDGYCGSPTWTEEDATVDVDEDEQLARAVRAATHRYKLAAVTRGSHAR